MSENSIIPFNPFALTKVKQSRIISQRTYPNFTALHYKLLVYTIKKFQDDIKNSMNAKQLVLNFDEKENEIVKIPILLKEFTSSRKEYKKIFEVAKDLKKTDFPKQKIEINGALFSYEPSVFVEVYEPVIVNKASVIYVDIRQQLYKDIVNVFFQGEKALYTEYYYEIIMNNQNKYLPKLYWFLCDNAKLGSRKISFYDLAKEIGCNLEQNPSYKKDISLFNSNIINPIRDDLYSQCKFYFNYTYHKYKTKPADSDCPYYYIFTIINREDLLKIENQVDWFKTNLDKYFPDNYAKMEQLMKSKGVAFDLELFTKLNAFILDYILKPNNVNEPLAVIQSMIVNHKK